MNDETKGLQFTHKGMRVHVLEQNDTLSIRVSCVRMQGTGGGLISVPAKMKGRLTHCLEMLVEELKKWNM